MQGEDEDPQCEFEKKERKGALDHAMGLLKPKYRDIIDFDIYFNLTDQQIADKLGIPIDTVLTQKKRAKKKLETLLRPLEQ